MTYKTGGIADAGPAIIIGLLIGLIAAHLLGTGPKPADAQQQPAQCPAGSYLLDYKDEAKTMPICKLEPTGCPYGDSIQLGPECDKHKPAEPAAPVQEPNPAPVKAECGGK